jgi:hypothetical protein
VAIYTSKSNYDTANILSSQMDVNGFNKFNRSSIGEICIAKCEAENERIVIIVAIYTGCPSTGSPEKKGSLRANILTCILKKRSPISNDNREKTF